MSENRPLTVRTLILGVDDRTKLSAEICVEFVLDGEPIAATVTHFYCDAPGRMRLRCDPKPILLAIEEAADYKFNKLVSQMKKEIS